ncbi:MAG: inverse autotransporter beta domain-containing protein, partial [Planctomycetaceae bacterium]
ASPFDAYGAGDFGNADYGNSDYGSADYGAPGYGPDDGPRFDRWPAFDAVFGSGAPLWVGYLSANYVPGTERTLFNGDLFLPLWQDGRTLWFLDIRGQVDNDDAGELNIGTGVRTLARPGLVFGTYLFYDRLYSANDNGFNQGTFGVEVMDVGWDYRFNVYFPESKAKPTSTPPSASISNGTIVVNSGEERAYWGMDFEAGALLGAWGPNAQHELRGFAGLYHFDHSAAGYDNITGPRVRLEWRYHDIPMFGNGSRLTCGFTLQADTERGGDAFAFIGLRVPLDPWANARRPLSRLQRRMVDPVVRDVDVVTNTRAMTEAAVNPHTGETIDSVHVLDSDDNLAQLISGYNDNSVVVIDGGKDEFVSRSAINLRPGQLVIGGGAQTAVRGERTGRTAVWTAPGTRPTVEFNANHCPPGLVCTMVMSAPPPGFLMADGSSLTGIDVRGGQPAITVDGVENVAVTDVSIRNSSGAGILIDGAGDVSIEEVSIDGVSNALSVPYQSSDFPDVFAEAADAHRGVGIAVVHSRDVDIRHIDVRHVVQSGLKFVSSQEIAISNATTENTGGPGVRLLRTDDAVLKWVDVRNHGLLEGGSPRIELLESNHTQIDRGSLDEVE